MTSSPFYLLRSFIDKTFVNSSSFICRHVEGGMGAVSLAISRATKEVGVHIETNAEVCFP